MTETHEFQAEVQEVLHLMIHSLYSNREIFLRELISNASDALDKRRFEGLTNAALVEGQGAPHIRLELDPSERRLVVRDNGIGMSHDELVSNLGTIARSGTRAFLDSRQADATAALPQLIGQFGVGFYASFMVADAIEVESRKAGEPGGHIWSSRGDGKFTIEPSAGLAVGTAVRLALKPKEADDEAPDFADAQVLRSLVRKYSDFVEYPIELAGAHLPGLPSAKTDDGSEVVVLNSRRPLWARPKAEIQPAEYAEFYKHIAHDWNDPLETIHFRAEGANQYTALLYLPKERPLDLFEAGRERSHVALYVKRVFITADCEGLVPSWLRFVRGVVDSDDLPLNVSREVLQENRIVRAIQKRLVHKLLDAFGELLRERRADYVEFWSAFGLVVKEGLVVDAEHKDALARVALFDSTLDEGGPWTLAEYVGRMAPKQEAIYYLTGDERAQLARSPHIEALRSKGSEVLLLTDPVDEWVVQHLREFEGKPLVSVDRGLAEHESEAEREERERLDREHRNLLGSIELALAEWVGQVRFSTRLTDSPAVLVNAEDSLSPNMQRILKATQREVPESKRILELNPKHPLIRALEELQAKDPASARLRELSRLLHGQALLAEGATPPEPAEFAKLVSSAMLAAAAAPE